MTVKPPTVYDVAAHAGVSIATVSRVLRRPDDVRPATRSHVLESVRQLGYVPSASARGLAARRTGVLGLYFPDFDAVAELSDTELGGDVPLVVERDIPPAEVEKPTNLYFDEVLRGCELEAWRHRFSLLVGVGRGADPAEMVNDIAGRVDGMAVLATSVPDDVLEHVARRVPVALIAGPRRDDDFDHVAVRNVEGMRVLTEHLVDVLGVREPVFVSGPDGSPDAYDRFLGFRAALESRGVERSAIRVVPGGFLRSDGVAVATALLAEGRLPRAVVCANDQMALGVLEVFHRVGIDVPGRVIVTGFDGLEAGRTSVPPLTTVRQPMVDLGRAAMRALFERIEHPDCPPQSVQLPVRVLLRESSEGSVPRA